MKLGALVYALVFAVGMLAGPAEAGVPTEQLKTATDRVLKVLQDAELKQPAKREERRKQIRAIADQIFDWQETGKRALARHWQGRSPSEREEFSALFSDLIERSYISKIETYGGEKIQYTGERMDGDYATVSTRIVTKNGTEVPVDYRMVKRTDHWLVYDVSIEGVSLVSSYRTQFNKIIQTSSYNELVTKLRTKQDELIAEDKGQKKKL